MLSLDSRAGAQVARRQADGAAVRSFSLTGQEPHVSAPSALLAWVRSAEPERFAAIGHILARNDWLRYCLTGTSGTNRTEARTSFTAVHTQDFAPDPFDLFRPDALAHALPSIAGSVEIVGHVIDASATGLSPGTPVAAGLHDVTASARGIGALLGSRMAPRSRGALLVTIGPMLYDLSDARPRVMPRHRMLGRMAALASLPALTPRIQAVGCYHAASITVPERLVLELVQDGVSLSPGSAALNWMPVTGQRGGVIALALGLDLSVDPAHTADGASDDHTQGHAYQ